jgi:hypothetical protein
LVAVTRKPLASRILPMDAAITPFPIPDITPPVTKTNFAKG